MAARSWFALCLALQVGISSVAAQTAPPQPAPAPSVLAENLRVRVLQGDGAINDVRTLQAVAPVVEVSDANDRPIEGADVVFQLPASGPGGFFPGQQLTRTTRTNSQGQAWGAGLIPNSQTGRFVIQVRAQSGTRFGRAEIHQTNTAGTFQTREVKTPSRVSRRLLWLSIIGGGTVAAVYFATRNGSTSSSFALVPGPVVISEPR